MTLYDQMTDAELDAEIERLALEITDLENCHDTEEVDLTRWMIRSVMESTLEDQRRAMAERSRRMGFWIGP